MGCLRAEKIIDYLSPPLQKALVDEHPYVRKTAALCELLSAVSLPLLHPPPSLLSPSPSSSLLCFHALMPVILTPLDLAQVSPSSTT
jgi:non-SMC mitotic condensation complex subunit 1